MNTRFPTEEVAEATTVQPEGDPAQAGAGREPLEPVEVAGRRPEPLTGPTSQEGCHQTPALPGESGGCQGGPIQDLAREQHHPGSHGPRVLPPVDHIPVARPVRYDGLDGYIAACLCGWEHTHKFTVAAAGTPAHARSWARLVAERHACTEEDKVSRPDTNPPGAGRDAPDILFAPGVRGTPSGRSMTGPSAVDAGQTEPASDSTGRADTKQGTVIGARPTPENAATEPGAARAPVA